MKTFFLKVILFYKKKKKFFLEVPHVSNLIFMFPFLELIAHS